MDFPLQCHALQRLPEYISGITIIYEKLVSFNIRLHQIHLGIFASASLCLAPQEKHAPTQTRRSKNSVPRFSPGLLEKFH